MTVNIFEGCRRIVKIIILFWVIGFVITIGFHIHKYYELNWKVESELTENHSSKDGKTLFEMHKRSEDYATWIVKNKHLKGTPDFDSVAKAYELEKQEATTASQNTPQQWLKKEHAKVAWWSELEAYAIWFLGGIFILFIFTLATGWVARGFLGIPTGKDYKE